MGDDSRVLYAVDIPGTTVDRLEEEGYEIVSDADDSQTSLEGIDCVVAPRSRPGDDVFTEALSERPDVPIVSVLSNGGEATDEPGAVVRSDGDEYGDLTTAIEAAIEGGTGTVSTRGLASRRSKRSTRRLGSSWPPSRERTCSKWPSTRPKRFSGSTSPRSTSRRKGS